MILSIVHAAGTTRCTTEGLRIRPLSVDELFYYGQLNTDAIPITITQKSGPTTCPSGPSPFIAAKAANMPAVIKQHAIEAPHGIFALIPQQHLLFVAPATPNDLVIHQQDIEDTMNALWSGGAEAMTVQGVRITSRTVIRCIGNVILVDGTSFSPPYVIQAIGDPATLRATVTANPRMVNYQAYVSKYGLGWDMQTKDSLSFAPATTSLTVNYATVEETNG